MERYSLHELLIILTLFRLKRVSSISLNQTDTAVFSMPLNFVHQKILSPESTVKTRSLEAIGTYLTPASPRTSLSVLYSLVHSDYKLQHLDVENLKSV